MRNGEGTVPLGAAGGGTVTGARAASKRAEGEGYNARQGSTPFPMNDFAAAAPYVLLAAYAAATAAYGVLFFGGGRVAPLLARPLLQLAIVLHVVYLGWLTWRWEQFPGATVSQALSVVAFAIAILYLFLEWLGGERATGVWLVGQVMVFQLLAVVLHGPQPPKWLTLFWLSCFPIRSRTSTQNWQPHWLP